MQELAAKWFVLYYFILGLLFFISGFGLMIKTSACFQYLSSQSDNEQPPPIIKTILKYFFLFTIPGLVFSFTPFSWAELLFALWSLIMVYLISIQLVRWSQTRQIIRNHPGKMRRFIKIAGAIMVAVSPVIFVLGYLVILRI